MLAVCQRRGDILSRAKGADKKTPIYVTGAQIWGIYSSTPFTDYGPPWDKIGGDLWGRLLGTLATPAAQKIAGEASLLSYSECAKLLLHKAPEIHRVVMDIRGLALAAAPPAAVKVARAPLLQPKNKLPGDILIYDDVTFY
jgi:hypothetical protein